MPSKTSFLLLYCFLVSLSTSVFGQKHIFFLHSKFIEQAPLDSIHPVYGKAEYLEVLDKLKQGGFIVHSEKRDINTVVLAYSKLIISEIDDLLHQNIKPSDITIIGTSKGGYIAQIVSSELKNPLVNFVFIGCYMQSDLVDFPNINYCGNVLCIYEKTDKYGVSSIDRKNTSTLEIPRFFEIELNTGLKHAFLFQTLDAWIIPAMKWANGQY